VDRGPFIYNTDNLIRSNTFLYHSNPHLALCPVTVFIATAFADEAFALPGLQTPQQLLNLKIPEGLNELHIPWTPAVLDTPIFRQCSDFSISSLPLSSHTLGDQLSKLGREAYLPMQLTCYALRRGTANCLDGKFPEPSP